MIAGWLFDVRNCVVRLDNKCQGFAFAQEACFSLPETLVLDSSFFGCIARVATSHRNTAFFRRRRESPGVRV
jgi:hypothetical protein